MMEEKRYVIPEPILDSKEEKSLEQLTERYNKLIEPSKMAKLGAKATVALPEKVKVKGNELKESIVGQDLYIQAMKMIGEGFQTVQDLVSKYTISENTILEKIDELVPENHITSFDEVCFARGYDLSKLVNSFGDRNKLYALVEGGATGYLGFAGLPANLVVSTFLYYRAVQLVAMFYGYDVRNEPSELVIASSVFANSINPAVSDADELSSVVAKVMLISEATAIKQAAQKSWSEVISQGGIGLLLTQMRALANKSAKKALEVAGKKGLEESVFKKTFEQIGKQLTLKSIQKAVPYVSAAIGALLDTAQMKKVLNYADVFYNKRFILEKEERISAVISNRKIEIVDIQ